MFESAEIGHRIDKSTYAKQEPKLREALLTAQFKLRESAQFPVIIIVSGVDGSGKGDTINLLYEWMDPRYLSTLAFSAPNDEERQRPFMWRYWRALPPKGRIGIFSGSWYSAPIAERIQKTMTKAELDERNNNHNRFEAMLVNEGALVLKFWFHLSKAAQDKRLHSLQKKSQTAWRVDQSVWDRAKTYDEFQKVAGHLLRTTNTAWAPWHIIEATDDRYRNLTVGQIICDAINKKIRNQTPPHYLVAPNTAVPIDQRDVISALNLEQKISEEQYRQSLVKYQAKLWELSRAERNRKRAVIVVFEGADAAGKGGAIRRLAQAMDARSYQIVPIAAPTAEEHQYPYLWRFWRHLPAHGRMTIFDRSWYGRVLVERVEGFCTEADWLRAYSEINDFEHDLVESGAVVVKFWLQISKEEQLRRFEERKHIAFKQHKITEEDWRNRDKWELYHQAVCDMIERTSTGRAPWDLIEANHKPFARIKILKTLCKRLEKY